MTIGEELAWLRDPSTRQLVELYRVPKGSPLYEPFPSPRRFATPLLFSVRDIDPLIARLRRIGARVRVDFVDGEVRLVFLTDPDGTLVELVGWTPAARTAHREPPLHDLALPPHAERPRRSRARRGRSAG